MRNVGLKNILEFLRAGRVGARIGTTGPTVFENYTVNNGSGGFQNYNVSDGSGGHVIFKVRQS
jgi:hypothetical protein|tara:strand:- start:1718 stop:1906 length:189 start_codon:yes stop_codon:yes gene_type:complete